MKLQYFWKAAPWHASSDLQHAMIVERPNFVVLDRQRECDPEGGKGGCGAVERSAREQSLRGNHADR